MAPPAPQPDSAGAVSRGMGALLARREADVAAGAAPIGWKIGFNTPAIQEHFGLIEPVVGYLTKTRVVEAGVEVPLAGWAVPAVEVEMAVRVGDDGGVGGLAPALELVDLGEPLDDIEPVLAGNICHRGVVFGDEIPGADPWSMVAAVHKDGAVVAEGRLTEDPATTVTFVRTFLATYGAALAPGDRIIAGSVVPPVTVAPGDDLEVSFGPFGTLSIAFC